MPKMRRFWHSLEQRKMEFCKNGNSPLNVIEGFLMNYELFLYSDDQTRPNRKRQKRGDNIEQLVITYLNQ